jgi:hypothetical protein
MILKKLCRIFGVSLEPVSGISQPKTVTPRIHVEHQPISANPFDTVRQHDLQVANGRFLKIVAACITYKTATSFPGHTDNVARLMEQ